MLIEDALNPLVIEIHTHGFERMFSHPDLQFVHPLPTDKAMLLMNKVVELIRAGRQFKAGDETEDVLEGCRICFVAATESGRPVLRMVVPGPNGHIEYEPMAPLFNLKHKSIGIR